MARIPAELIYRIDRIFRRPRVEGRESALAYSEWEYRTGMALVERYSRYFGRIGGARLLDIGCGLGGKTVVYGEKGALVTGVDIDPINCGGAASFAGSRGRRVDVACGDALALPFRDGSFDFVVANDSMEHFSDPGKALGEIARVTRKGGSIFIFFTPWGSPLGSHLYDHIRTPWCHRVFGEGLLQELLEISLREKGSADPAAGAAAMMNGYREENNRIDVAAYRRILKRMNGIEVEYEELIPPKYRFLAPLAKIPRLGEYFTGTVVSVLRKTV